MNIVSLNIREGGGGSKLKRKRINFIIHSRKFDICFLQETKIKDFDGICALDLWGNKDVEWTSSDPVGASCNLVII